MQVAVDGELRGSTGNIWAYNRAYIFGSVIVRPLTSCLAGDLRVRGFVPESRDSLVSSESDSAALAPLLAPRTMSLVCESRSGTQDLVAETTQGYRNDPAARPKQAEGRLERVAGQPPWGHDWASWAFIPAELPTDGSVSIRTSLRAEVLPAAAIAAPNCFL